MWPQPISQVLDVIKRHPSVSLALGIMGAVAAYDTFSGQVAQLTDYELPSLHKLFSKSVAVGGHLLPWWGWVIMLLVILNLALLWQRLPATKAETPKPVAPPPLASAKAPIEIPMVTTNPPQALERAPYPGQGMAIAARPSSSSTPALSRQETDMAPRRVAEAVLGRVPQESRAKIVRDWSRVGSLELWQAGALWANELPGVNRLFPTSEATRANVAMLMAAAMDGEIDASAVHPGRYEAVLGRQIDEQSRVSRDGLLVFANGRSEYPLFLFPDGPA